jgi:hypothetical protein
MARRRKQSQLGRLGKWVEVQPFGKCDFVGYHGTYKLRASLIKRDGLRVGTRGIWFTRSPKYAFEHIAKRAVMEGCPNEPITVLKVRIVGSAGHCPVYRPLRAKSLPEFYMTDEPIPPARILGEVAKTRTNTAAINKGRAAGFKRLKKEKKPRPVACPPPVELQGRRKRR